MRGRSTSGETRSTGTRCPVTGLPVHSRAEWSEVRFSDGYRVSLSTVGDRMLLVRAVGYCTETDIQRSSMFLKRVADEVVPAGQTYVQIGDYSRLDGVTVAARRYYIQEIQARDRLAGVVFFGASPLMQLVIKLGWRINPLPFQSRLVEDYGQAVLAAQQLLLGATSQAAAAPAPRGWLERLRPRRLTEKAGRLGSRMLQDGERLLTWPRLLVSLATSGRGPAPPPVPAWPELRRPLDSTHLDLRPELDLDLAGLSVRYGLVGDDVLHAATTGYLEHRHVEPVVQRNEEAVEALLGDRPYYFLIGLTDVTGARVRARQAYARQMTSFFHEHPFRLLVLYSPNRVMRTLIDLARPLVPFRVLVAPNLDSALRLVAEDRSPGRTARRTPLEGGTPRDHLSDLLRFLGSIDWDADGLGGDAPEISPWHPLKQIFDAVEVLKMDVDQLLLERREAEEALRKSENLLRTYIDATNEAILTVDEQGRVGLFNAAAEALFGQPAGSVQGAPFEELLEPSSREHWRELLRRHLDGEVLERRLEELPACRFGGGVFPLELSLASAVHDGRRYTIAVGRDLTARQQAAAEREKLQQQLTRGHRLRALGTLAGGVAHDFNNLLMAIQGGITLLLMDSRPGSEAHANLKTIERQIRSGASLTRQLLAYARKGKYALRPLDLNKVLASTSETFWRTRKDIRVHRDLQQDLRAIDADRSQLEQVVLNLALNAGDAMPQGGDLYFTTRNVAPGEGHRGLRAPGPGPQVMIEVRDTGQGMDRDTLDRIFEPFFTTKEMGRGTGLGLASVYGTVQNHGGQIHVTSEVGQGTTFTIFLPASEHEEQVSQPRKPGLAPVRGTLLLVDDEPLVLKVSGRVMSRAGFEVLTAGGGEEAVKVFEQHGERIDLVVLDLIMPDMSGAETYDRLKELDPGVRVLLSSGYTMDGEAQRIMDRGCDGFIQKPFDVEEFTALINNILRPRD